MADNNKLSAEVRESFGKGAARKIRALNKIPAVLYGHGTEPRHLTLPGHETMLLLRRANAVLDLDIQGEAQLALVKDVQKDPVRQIIEHVDLIVVKKGEKVQVEVPVVLEGESFPGTLASLETTTLTVEVEATHIPQRLTVDVEGLEEGAQIFAKDVELPKGANLLVEDDVLVVNVTVPVVDTEGDEGAEAEGETAEAAEAEAAEGDAE